MSAHDLGALAKYHEFTREHRANRLVYRLSHAILKPALIAYLRLTRTGMETIPREGAVLIVANHRSFLDPFLIATLLRAGRPLNFMGKAELFARPRAGWYVSRVGCFPVRRGESDPEALETARRVLAGGGVLVVFPEGTRLRWGGLGEPRRGAFRLAIQTGASVVPVCVIGAENVRRAKVIVRPVHCQVHAGPPIPVEPEVPTPENAGALMEQAWESVRSLWLERGGSPEPGRRERPPLRERLRARSWPSWPGSRR
ncbi:MAG TPA: lysophospholipid acyltransferase family protein [Solirubrobacteraceae bacterium]|nr:lysophospholipid acyltransferase family protein [Solirubrobacteraceae bacterium]